MRCQDRPGENWVGSPAMEAIRQRLESVSVNWSQHLRMEDLRGFSFFAFCNILRQDDSTIFNLDHLGSKHSNTFQ